MTLLGMDVVVSSNPAVAAFAALQRAYLTGAPSTTYVYSAQRTHALYGPVGGAPVPATCQGIGGLVNEAWESVR